MSCCTEPCDGSRCHIECVVSTIDREECTCHCGGEFHGTGARAAGGPRVPLRERVANTRQAIKLRRLDDDQLGRRLAEVDWSNTAEVLALAKESDRRDRASSSAKRRRIAKQDAHDSWHEIAHAQMSEAEASEFTAGNLFSKRGARLASQRGVTEIDLWRMSRTRANAYASDELKEWWDRHDGGHPRTTPRDVRADRARNARYERDQADEHAGNPYPGVYPG